MDPGCEPRMQIMEQTMRALADKELRAARTADATLRLQKLVELGSLELKLRSAHHDKQEFREIAHRIHALELELGIG